MVKIWHGIYLQNVQVNAVEVIFKLEGTMGRIFFGKGELISEIAERVGYKSGLSFSFDKMLGFVTDKDKSIILRSNYSSGIQIRAEEYEMLYYSVLEGTGYLARGQGRSIRDTIHIYLQKIQVLGYVDVCEKVIHEYKNFMNKEIEKVKSNNRNYGNCIDPTPFISKCKKEYGIIGMKIAFDIIEIMIQDQMSSPWYSQVRRIEWKDEVQLEELFESESLKTYYGSFIDQRYIDYLSNNLDDIGKMNWRKFEGLTGEFFKKNGYEVELGKGRNDGGVDIRVWKDKEDKENPPLILIQCKRQKDKVESEIVKALWADVYEEKAVSGLIVTSSKMSKGAKHIRKARAYNVGFAEKDTLIKWVKSMRSSTTNIII